MNRIDVAQLIKQCAEGDDSSRAQFYNLYHDLIIRAAAIAFRKYQPTGFSQSDVQEAAHDIFLKITKNNYAALVKLHQPNSINAWLMRVSHNHVVSLLRKDSTRNRAHSNAAHESPQTYESTPHEDAIRAERHQILHRSLQSLSPKERLMLDLYYAKGRKYSEIAELLNININTVASGLNRARNKLHKHLKDILQ